MFAVTTADTPVSDPGARGAGSGTLRSAGALLASRLVVAVLGWSGTVLIARELGEDGFGAFTLVFSILGMLSIVTDLGLGRVALAGLLDPEEDSARFAGTYVVLRATLGLLGYAIVVALVLLAGYDDVVVRATLVAGLVPVLATPAHAYEIAFQAHHRLGQTAWVRVIAQSGQLALTVALVVSGRSLVWLTVPAVLHAALVLSLSAPLAHRLESFRYGIDRQIWMRLLREAVPLSIGTAMATLYYRVDSVMLSKLDDFAAVGIYGVAYKFVDIAHLVPSVLSVAILAVLVGSWPADLDRFRTTLRNATALLTLLGGLLVVEFALFAEDIITLLYGDAYGAGDTATRVLLVAEWAGYFTSLSFATLVATGQHGRYPLITLTGLVLNIAINLVLIPLWSFEGAAVATLVTEVCVAALMVREVRRIPQLSPVRVGPLWRIAGPIGVALISGLLVARYSPWIVAATATAVVYLVVADRVRFSSHRSVRQLAEAW